MPSNIYDAPACKLGMAVLAVALAGIEKREELKGLDRCDRLLHSIYATRVTSAGYWAENRHLSDIANLYTESHHPQVLQHYAGVH